jgi:hypothetical protein
MKIAITGHTSGIGLALYNHLSKDNSVIGFSKSTGYDIITEIDRSRIIESSFDCDIFINNAPAEFGQTMLFLELFKKWHDDSNKTIINVGSRIAEIKSLPLKRYDLLKYQAEKLILKEMSNRVQGKCKVKYKWFGYVGTEKILKKYPNFTKSDYITEDKAVEIILS